MLTSKLLKDSLKSSRLLSFENVTVRYNAALAGTSLEESYFRTTETNPANHDVNHLGQ